MSRAYAAWLLEGKVPAALLTHDCSRSPDCRICRDLRRKRKMKRD